MGRKKKGVEWFYKRIFLNRKGHQSSAFFYGEVSKREGDLHIDLKLGDCDRVVSFDFDHWTETHWKNSLKKASLLRDGMDGFYKGLEAAYEDWKGSR